MSDKLTCGDEFTCRHQSIDRNGKCRVCNTVFVTMVKQEGDKPFSTNQVLRDLELTKKKLDIAVIGLEKAKELLGECVPNSMFGAYGNITYAHGHVCDALKGIGELG